MNWFSKSGPTVSDDQVQLYRSQGFILVSGLIANSLIQAAAKVLLSHIPNGTTGSHQQVLTDRALLKCVTKEVTETARRLTGISGRLKPPSSVYTLAVGPEPGAWHWPEPHIDHSKLEHRFRSLPSPFRIGCLIYLSDVLPQGGGTVVWPESHRQLAALITNDPTKYEFLAAVNADIKTLPLNDPREIVAKTGDVLFYDSLCAHAGSKNTGSAYRLALNHKW